MNNQHKDSLKMAIYKAINHFDYNVFVSLLLIRKASLWDSIARVLDLPEEQYVPSVIQALRCLPLPDFFLCRLIDSIQNSKIDTSAFREIVSLLSYTPMEDDFLLSLYEYFIMHEVRTISSATGDFYTPRQIVQLLVQLLDIQGGDIYDPCCGSGGFLCVAAKMCERITPMRLFGQVLSDSDFQTCQTNLFLHGLQADFGKSPANTLLNDLHAGDQFSYILANPPFNAKNWYDGQIVNDPRWVYGIPPRSNANYAWLQHIIYHLSETGRAVIILPNGVLTSKNTNERLIRERILRDRLVESIIALPKGLFYGTKIPCNIWIINKQQSRDSVLLIDASQMGSTRRAGLEEETIQRLLSVVYQYRKAELENRTSWYAVASLEELAQKSFNLSPNLYTLFEELPLEPMQPNRIRFLHVIDGLAAHLPAGRLTEQIIQWKSAEMSSHWKSAPLTNLYEISGGVTKPGNYFKYGTPMVGVNDVIRQTFLSGNFTRQVFVSPGELQKYEIRRGDILMNRTSENIDDLACCSLAVDDIPVVYSGFIKRLRPKPTTHLDPFYAAAYFQSAVYRQEVKRVSPVYTTRANINMEQLGEILCYYPEPETQKQIGQALYAVFNYQQICCDAEISAMLEEFARLLIEQQITYPIRIFQQKVGRS